MDIAAYLDDVRAQFESGHATEHSYRPALYKLFQSIDPALTVVNEPKRGDAGMVDFLFERDGVPFGWAEAKDIDKDVIKLKGYSIEQRKRYEAAYPNLIYTNGVDFEFIRDGAQVHFVSIADFLMGLQPSPDRFEELERQLRLFAEQKPISIRSAAKLAEMMAAKAAIIKDEIGIALSEDPDFRSGLGGQFKSFRANLLPALEPGEFADIYAETITYGMFAARFHDTELDTFSRQEAMERLPASNPFLKGLFEYIAGPQLPPRLKYIVDDLVHVMRASDPHSLFRDFGKFTARNDPFIHFYEDFLAAYNPKKRKSRGVWYTPEPVVDFIVRAVDDVLKTEFGLPDGLADTSKVSVDWDTGQDDPKTGKARTIKKDVHKVQILDPATGTGTFLAKAVQLISDRVKTRAPGKWSNYVEQDLMPRLHGFELLMASYAMCHMKLDMQLTESGYKPSARPPRLSVWLTNSLEPAERDVKDLFFQPLADEARGASEVKRQTPIMCVIGNPPYSAQSQNKGGWISNLVEDYKADLIEKKINLDDDYIKFIRLAQYYVEKNGAGVIGMITNNSYLDGVTHRSMRLNLLKSFDKIYLVDLHGSSTKKELSPDGEADKNVFDIMQGVSLVIFVKNSAPSDKFAQVLHYDMYGSRTSKNEFLRAMGGTKVDYSLIEPSGPYYFFAPKDFSQIDKYQSFFEISELYISFGSGVKTERDNVTIHFDRDGIEKAVSDFITKPEAQLRHEYALKKDSRDWTVAGAARDLKERLGEDHFTKITYRPFDFRYTYYTGKTRGFMGTPGKKIGLEFRAQNLGLILSRTVYGAAPWQDVQVTDSIVEFGIMATRVGNTAPIFPLYLYPNDGSGQADAFAAKHRTLNLEPKLYTAICTVAGIDPAVQAGPDDDFRAATGEARPSEVKVFDYIYGVLHSPAYRETYAEFLKIDFPRIPYPKSPDVFAHVSEKGEALRRLHLMEAAAIGETPYRYDGPDDGDDVVASGFPKWEKSGTLDQVRGDEDSGSALGRVFINKDQYFEDVPEIAWNFYIGGYQPAQKWLKDRRGRVLSWDDIGHYQKIVKILSETDRVMKEIELPLE